MTKGKGWHGESRRHSEVQKKNADSTKTPLKSPEDYYIDHHGNTENYQKPITPEIAENNKKIETIMEKHDLDNANQNEQETIEYANETGKSTVYAIPVISGDNVNIYYTATNRPENMPDNSWRVM